MDASVTESLLTIFRSARNTISVVENLPPLPESEDEAKAIAEFFSESKIYSGASATLNNLLSTNVKNYSHGMFQSVYDYPEPGRTIFIAVGLEL